MHQRFCSILLFSLVAPLAGCGGDIDQRSLADQFNTVSTSVRMPSCPTPPNPLRKIDAVQGGGRSNSKPGQQVTVRGVVTADFQNTRQLHGFFMQQPPQASKAANSEGIFVYLPAKIPHVAPGRYVQVSGTIEATKSKAGDATTLTRIGAVTGVSDCGAGPAIEPRSVTLPVRSIKDFEALEGMLVTFSQPLTVSENYQLGHYGELLLSANGRLWQPFNHPALTDAAEIADLNSRSEILLDDGATVVHPNPIPYLSASDESGTRRSGDTVKNVVGILTRSLGDWRVQPIRPPLFITANPRPAVPADVGGNLRVASMNVLSYFTTLNERGAKTSAERLRQRDKLVSAIAGLNADVLGLIEIENSPDALNDLVTAVNAKMGSQTYAAINSGMQGTDAIKVAIIFKSAKVVPDGQPELPDSHGVESSGGLSRPPLAQHFSARSNGAQFWLVVNHLKSKSRCPTGTDSIERDLGQGCWNATRVRQAKALQKWVAGLVAGSDDANVLLLGDFNAYLTEDPIRSIASAGFEDLLQRLAPAERYSYVFAGRAGALDHEFASTSLSPQVSGVTIWHINADEPPVLDYTTGSKPDDRYAATSWRSSDHDPVLVGLNLKPRAAGGVR